LVDFRRVALDKGAAEVVAFDVPLERLVYTWPDGRRGIEEGDVTLLLGLSSADIRDSSTVAVPELVLAANQRQEMNA
jgi:beta-glucosidase